MALTRSEREGQFRANFGVSSGTYYEMRRKAESRGISAKTFDKVTRQGGGYAAAKEVATVAARDQELARFMALDKTGALKSLGDIAFSDFDSSMDYADIPDDFDWYYH